MSSQSNDDASALERVLPALFVVLWASGFIVARLVRPYADPETFVALRFALSALILVGVAIIGRAPWPRTTRDWGAVLIAGALMQGAFIGGVFWSVKHGLPAAVASLIAGLQPLMTGALAGPLLAERVSPRRWLGIVIGFLGAVLVLLPHLEGAEAVPKVAILSCFAATIGITLGTIWQKRIGATIDVRSGLAIQFIGGFLVILPVSPWRSPCGSSIRATFGSGSAGL